MQAEVLLSNTLRELRSGKITAKECGIWSAGIDGKFTLKVTYTTKE